MTIEGPGADEDAGRHSFSFSTVDPMPEADPAPPPAEGVVVLRAFALDIGRYHPDEVEVHAMWLDTPQSICVVFRRRRDGPQLIGMRRRFPPHARQDDPSSTGADFAEFLTEPRGRVPRASRWDEHGVEWLNWGDDPFPRMPGM